MEQAAAHAVSPDLDAVVCSRLQDGYAGFEGIEDSRMFHFLMLIS